MCSIVVPIQFHLAHTAACCSESHHVRSNFSLKTIGQNCTFFDQISVTPQAYSADVTVNLMHMLPTSICGLMHIQQMSL